MTKAENRAAAMAWHQERLRKMREERHATAIAADLEELHRLRDQLIFRSRVGVPYDALTTAIDDYGERLTGERHRLHDQRHSTGK